MNADFFSKGRIQNLDALRFIAFLAVFMEHLSLNVPEILQDEGFKRISANVFIRGYLGVNFFFVLSGFLISGRLLDEYQKNGKINLIAYFRRRAFRILPMFLFMLGLAYLLATLLLGRNETAPVTPFLFIHSNMWMMREGLPKNPMLSHLWSLSIEEQFYLIAPALILLFFISGRKKWIIGLLLISCILFRAIHLPSYGHTYFHSFTLMADFLFGSMLALLLREGKTFILKIGNLKKTDSALIYLIGIFLICSPGFDMGMPSLMISRAVYALFFCFVLAQQSLSTKSGWHFSKLPFAEKGGLISYGLYIFHPLGILLAGAILNLTGIDAGSAYLHMFMHAVLGLPLTWLMAEAGERGTKQLKNFFDSKVNSGVEKR